MKAKAIVRGLMGVAITLVLGFSVSASAKSVMALPWDPQVPAGAAILTCGGSQVWAMGGGYSSSGVLLCGVRQYANQTWSAAYTGCTASAIYVTAELRSQNTTWCSSPKVGWGNGQTCYGTLMTQSNGVCNGAHTVSASEISQ